MNDRVPAQLRIDVRSCSEMAEARPFGSRFSAQREIDRGRFKGSLQILGKVMCYGCSHCWQHDEEDVRHAE